MAEISIIVPVYNVEKYIRRCIDSLIAQTFEKIRDFVEEGVGVGVTATGPDGLFLCSLKKYTSLLAC